jgi:hypothetical protein
MRTMHTFRLPPDLAGKLADYALQKHVSQALVVETALASFLSPDGADRLEAALTDFDFAGTPINEPLVRDLATGTFLQQQRNVVLVGGTDPASRSTTAR